MQSLGMAKRKDEDFNQAAFRVVRESTSEALSTAKEKTVKKNKKKSKRITKSK
jgi:hypothetical protein